MPLLPLHPCQLSKRNNHAPKKFCPTKFLFLPWKVRVIWTALLLLIKPIIWATEYLGGIESKVWTWSGSKWPSMTVHSFCLAKSRNIPPKYFRKSPKIDFLRYFGIQMTWYLQSHLVWLRLCSSCMGSLLFLNFERFWRVKLLISPGTVKLWESTGKAGSLPDYYLNPWYWCNEIHVNVLILHCFSLAIKIHPVGEFFVIRNNAVKSICLLHFYFIILTDSGLL